MREGIKNFMKEMEAGLAGVSSLPMLPTYLGIEEAEPNSSPILVIDAGGTNLRIVKVQLGESGLTVLDSIKDRMPGTGTPISSEELITELVNRMEQMLDSVACCGFCFSYPAEILENRDGKVISFCKDVTVTGSEGMLLGEALNQELRRRGKAPLKICVLNDTVATYFGGISELAPKTHASAIGMILGTGMNSCYVERAENIKKINASYDMLINIEAGKYKLVEMQDYDREVDRNSGNPGEGLMEKQISGAYLGSVVYYALLQNLQESSTQPSEPETQLSGDLRNRLLAKGSISTEEISLFSADPDGTNALAQLCASQEEKELILAVIDNVVDRAARLVAEHLAAVMEHCNTGKSRTEPAVIIMEGSTWQKFEALQDRIKYYAHQIITLEQGRYFRFHEVESSNLIGSAAAAVRQN